MLPPVLSSQVTEFPAAIAYHLRIKTRRSIPVPAGFECSLHVGSRLVFRITLQDNPGERMVGRDALPARTTTAQPVTLRSPFLSGSGSCRSLLASSGVVCGVPSPRRQPLFSPDSFLSVLLVSGGQCHRHLSPMPPSKVVENMSF
jgi:hypothetical protein